MGDKTRITPNAISESQSHGRYHIKRRKTAPASVYRRNASKINKRTDNPEPNSRSIQIKRKNSNNHYHITVDNSNEILIPYNQIPMKSEMPSIFQSQITNNEIGLKPVLISELRDQSKAHQPLPPPTTTTVKDILVASENHLNEPPVETLPQRKPNGTINKQISTPPISIPKINPLINKELNKEEFASKLLTISKKESKTKNKSVNKISSQGSRGSIHDTRTKRKSTNNESPQTDLEIRARGGGGSKKKKLLTRSYSSVILTSRSSSEIDEPKIERDFFDRDLSSSATDHTMSNSHSTTIEEGLTTAATTTTESNDIEMAKDKNDMNILFDMIKYQYEHRKQLDDLFINTVLLKLTHIETQYEKMKHRLDNLEGIIRRKDEAFI